MPRVREYNPLYTIACSLSDRVPLTLGEMARLTGLSLDEVRPIRQTLLRRGLAAVRSGGVVRRFGPAIERRLERYWDRVHAGHDDLRRRRCVNCGESFVSRWSGHRRCPACLHSGGRDGRLQFNPELEAHGRFVGAAS